MVKSEKYMALDERGIQGTRVTVTGMIFNLLLVAVKLGAGLWGHSRALVADAVHSLSDFASDIIVLAGFRLSSKPEDHTHRYGHGKFEPLAAFLLGIFLLVTAGGIFWSGLKAGIYFFRGGLLPRPGWIALVAAVVSIITKELLYHYTIRTGKKFNSQSLMANAIHHRSDALSSLGTLAGVAGSILLGRNWRILDPLAAMAVGVFIVRAAVAILNSAGNELLEASLDAETEQRILELVVSVPGALNPHQLKTRRIGSRVAVDIHIEVDAQLNIAHAHHITREIEEKLKQELGASAIIYIHYEPHVLLTENS